MKDPCVMVSTLAIKYEGREFKPQPGHLFSLFFPPK